MYYNYINNLVPQIHSSDRKCTFFWKPIELLYDKLLDVSLKMAVNCYDQ